jgi:hypothetical protein
MTQEDIADWIGVSRLFARYSLALDTGDIDGIVSCFHPEGSLESPILGKVEGHANITAFAERFAGLRRGGAQLRHVVTNLQVASNGETARASAYLSTFLTQDGETRVLPPGVYDCSLVRTETGWVFVTRMLQMDAAYTLPFK